MMPVWRSHRPFIVRQTPAVAAQASSRSSGEAVAGTTAAGTGDMAAIAATADMGMAATIGRIAGRTTDHITGHTTAAMAPIIAHITGAMGIPDTDTATQDTDMAPAVWDWELVCGESNPVKEKDE